MALLTIRDLPDDFVEKVKRATHCRVGSKAFIEAGHGFIVQKDKIARLERELAAAREQIKVYQQTIEGARSAAALLLERVGQGDLLQPD